MKSLVFIFASLPSASYSGTLLFFFSSTSLIHLIFSIHLCIPQTPLPSASASLRLRGISRCKAGVSPDTGKKNIFNHSSLYKYIMDTPNFCNWTPLMYIIYIGDSFNSSLDTRPCSASLCLLPLPLRCSSFAFHLSPLPTPPLILSFMFLYMYLQVYILIYEVFIFAALSLFRCSIVCISI